MQKKKRVGLVHVYTGEGKGKTTTAVGLALRAAGHNLNVLIIQFLKGGGFSGEVEAFKKFENITITQFGKECPYSENIKSGEIECGNCKDCFLSRKEERDMVDQGLIQAEKAVKSNKFDVIILDEINNTVARKLTSVMRIKKLIKSKKSNIELVLTGRYAPKEFIELADYTTELKRVKHPFTKGLRARYGIDY